MWTRPTPDKDETWTRPSYVPTPGQSPVITPYRTDDQPLYTPSAPEFKPAEMPEQQKEMPKGPTMPGERACSRARKGAVLAVLDAHEWQHSTATMQGNRNNLLWVSACTNKPRTNTQPHPPLQSVGRTRYPLATPRRSRPRVSHRPRRRQRHPQRQSDVLCSLDGCADV